MLRLSTAGLLCILLGLLLASVWHPLPAQSTGSSTERPSVYLDQANIPRAKALALDAALIKGWRVAVSARDHSVFETRVQDPNAAGKSTAKASVLLRIRADFTRDANGVRVALSATEIRSPGTQAERQTDVTNNYRSNLNHALASLRTQWQDFALGGRRQAQAPPEPRAPSHSAEQSPSRPASRSTNQPQQNQPPPPAPTHHRTARRPPAPPAPPPEPVGLWAYEAERLASRHGCKVSARGSILFGDRAKNRAQDHEVHRVTCDNRSALLVRCNSEGCRMGLQ
ncbi:hypothetical protein [Rhabdochromatium marinum]|uniref:hypothetical protein n=1 Tax=Rhabdochromatium marinum TaxID=48729 RepID=UPI001907166D|nr:hypothetical protein [Rhabdochromatium marinum]MBK1648399.1 hypothetical protein [Rhabdochromatium marinum]